ncbi:hypothetical protein CPB85DRAFT_1433772 [Mucidula mucida]|nr:hypothetical protein CPB85DRAFT_1433767 [Mucidula mucida]KAF8914536.1 hypothetical protein CPB85DRAFT_1433772 [Mucidula mucida]
MPSSIAAHRAVDTADATTGHLSGLLQLSDDLNTIQTPHYHLVSLTRFFLAVDIQRRCTFVMLARIAERYSQALPAPTRCPPEFNVDVVGANNALGLLPEDLPIDIVEVNGSSSSSFKQRSRTTLNDFLWTGPQGPACLSGSLLPAISDAALISDKGKYTRPFVDVHVDHFKTSQPS